MYFVLVKAQCSPTKVVAAWAMTWKALGCVFAGGYSRQNTAWTFTAARTSHTVFFFVVYSSLDSEVCGWESLWKLSANTAFIRSLHQLGLRSLVLPSCRLHLFYEILLIMTATQPVSYHVVYELVFLYGCGLGYFLTGSFVHSSGQVPSKGSCI